ncbi:MAG: hypothetical protein QME79_11020 [Bacillota bacterium]|nr:hypothetical protein [Bacillota bacterium]
MRLRRLIAAVLYTVLFGAVTGLLLLLSGSYPNLRRAAAESALTSMHRNLAGELGEDGRVVAVRRGKVGQRLTGASSRPGTAGP